MGKAYALGIIAVVMFGLTLPATRIAVAELPATFVGLGRGIVAAGLGVLFLYFSGARRPTRGEFAKLAGVAAGVIFGFPLFSALAMKFAPASHGGVVLGILPLATAVAGVLVARERLSPGFWLCGIFGSVAVVTFALLDGGAEVHMADSLLVVAVVAAAGGYALGGELSRTLGGSNVISWALVISLPLLAVPVLWVLPDVKWDASWQAWGAFAYVAVFSQFLGFFFWNKALALGGVAQIGQVQLLQVFVTLIGSAFLLDEVIAPVTIVFAVIVVATVAVGRRMRVERAK